MFAGADDSGGHPAEIDNNSSNDATDFHIADVPITSFIADGRVQLQDSVTTEANPDFDQINWDHTMFDISERYMICPLSEVNAEMDLRCDMESFEEALPDADDACLFLAVQQARLSGQSTGVCVDLAGDICEVDSFDPHLFFNSLPELPENWPVILPRLVQKRTPNTLVLDLDETLVHSTLVYCEDADFTFQVHFNMKVHTVYVRQRPCLQIFLEAVAEMFEIIIFTASKSIYAEQLLDILDPDHRLFSHRVYRESCVFSEGAYVKDLTVLGRDLAKIAIVDNSPEVFQLQVDNGIPIQSWFGDPSDRALLSLLPFLETLVGAEDVRPVISTKFKCQEQFWHISKSVQSN